LKVIMTPEEIKGKFKKVSDEVSSSASQQEQDVTTKVAAIRDEAVKKFSSAVS